MTKTFPRGIHVGHRKELTQSLPIQRAALPRRVILPLQQNLGAPAEAIVKVGDVVAEGQKVSEVQVGKIVIARSGASLYSTKATLKT